MKLRSLTLCLFILALSFTAGAREKSGGEGEGLQKSAIIGETKRIAVNRINLPLENNGDVGQSGASWFPNGQESLSFLFAGGPAMSGYVNGDLRTAWMASASRQYETQPGRTGSAPDDPLAKFYIVDNRKDSFGSAAYVVTAVPDYRKVVNEMIRVCKPGGRIVMLNHFSNGNKVIAAVEKLISPLCKHIGFRTDLALNTVLEGTSLLVASKKKVNPLRFWHLVECVNKKNGQEHEMVYANGYASLQA